MQGACTFESLPLPGAFGGDWRAQNVHSTEGSAGKPDRGTRYQRGRGLRDSSVSPVRPSCATFKFASLTRPPAAHRPPHHLALRTSSSRSHRNALLQQRAASRPWRRVLGSIGPRGTPRQGACTISYWQAYRSPIVASKPFVSCQPFD